MYHNMMIYQYIVASLEVVLLMLSDDARSRFLPWLSSSTSQHHHRSRFFRYVLTCSRVGQYYDIIVYRDIEVS